MTSKPVDSFLPEVTEDVALVLDWLKQMNTRHLKDDMSAFPYVSHMAYICLFKYWTKPVENGKYALVEVDDFWQADVSWFGEGFVDKLTARDGIVYVAGGDMQEKLALASFSRHLADKYRQLYLSLIYWVAVNNDFAVPMEKLELFYPVREYVVIRSPEDKATTLGDICYTARSLDNLAATPDRKEWARDIKAGDDIITSLAGVLLHFESRFMRVMQPA